MSYSAGGASAITAFGSAYASGIAAKGQAEASKIVSDAMASYNAVMREKTNEASNYNASQNLNIIAMNELFVNAETQQKKQEVQMEVLAAQGQANAMMNAMGISGKTADRLKKRTSDAAALAMASIDDSKEKQQLNFMFDRKAVEQKRISGKDYGFDMPAPEYTGNPLMAGLTAGLVSGAQTYAALGNSTTKPQTYGGGYISPEGATKSAPVDSWFK